MLVVEGHLALVFGLLVDGVFVVVGAVADVELVIAEPLVRETI